MNFHIVSSVFDQSMISTSRNSQSVQSLDHCDLSPSLLKCITKSRLGGLQISKSKIFLARPNHGGPRGARASARSPRASARAHSAGGSHNTPRFLLYSFFRAFS